MCHDQRQPAWRFSRPARAVYTGFGLRNSALSHVVRGTLCGLVIVTAAAHRPGVAGAQSRRETASIAAERHLREGLRQYILKAYDRAVRELEAGYAIEPRPEFLYALGQTYRMRGACEQARRYYREFLARNPRPREAQAALSNLERCQDAPAASASRPTAPPPAAAVPVAKVARPAPSSPTVAAVRVAEVPRPARWYRDGLGLGLAGSGVAVLVAGSVLFLHGRSTVDDIAAARSYDDFARTAHDGSGAETQQTVGVAMMAVGGALVAAGVVRAVLVRRAARATVTVGTWRGGAAALAWGRF